MRVLFFFFEDMRSSDFICKFYLYKKVKMKNRTRSGHGRGTVSWRTHPHLLINIYIYYEPVNLGQCGSTRWKTGRWKPHWTEASEEGTQSGKRRTKDIYDIHDDVSLGTLSVRTKSDPRRRDTRQSQNIWDENWFPSLFPLPKLLLGTWFRHNVASILQCSENSAPRSSRVNYSGRKRGPIWCNVIKIIIQIAIRIMYIAY